MMAAHTAYSTFFRPSNPYAASGKRMATVDLYVHFAQILLNLLLKRKKGVYIKDPMLS